MQTFTSDEPYSGSGLGPGYNQLSLNENLMIDRLQQNKKSRMQESFAASTLSHLQQSADSYGFKIGQVARTPT